MQVYTSITQNRRCNEVRDIVSKQEGRRQETLLRQLGRAKPILLLKKLSAVVGITPGSDEVILLNLLVT